jgi:hypothetical protein
LLISQKKISGILKNNDPINYPDKTKLNRKNKLGHTSILPALAPIVCDNILQKIN